MNTAQSDPDPTKTVSYQGIHGLPDDDLAKNSMGMPVLPIEGIGKTFADSYDRTKIVPALDEFRECVQNLLRVHDTLGSFIAIYSKARREYETKMFADVPWRNEEVVVSRTETLKAIAAFQKGVLGSYLPRPEFANFAELLRDSFAACGEVKALLLWYEKIGDHYSSDRSTSNSNPAIIGGCLARLELAINSLLKPG